MKVIRFSIQIIVNGNIVRLQKSKYLFTTLWFHSKISTWKSLNSNKNWEMRFTVKSLKFGEKREKHNLHLVPFSLNWKIWVEDWSGWSRMEDLGWGFLAASGREKRWRKSNFLEYTGQNPEIVKSYNYPRNLRKDKYPSNYKPSGKLVTPSKLMTCLLNVHVTLTECLMYSDKSHVGRGGPRHLILVWLKFQRNYDVNYTKNNK